MSLTAGSAPFGPRPAGRFNFERPGPVLYWEDFKKRVRVEFGGEMIADSRNVKALHETGELMVLYFPRDDVRMDRLEPTDHRTESVLKGIATYWTVSAGARTARNAAWSYEEPPASAPPIGGYVSFAYGEMDAWYQEEERVYAHPRDPYHRVDVHRSDRHVVIRHAEAVVADSRRPALLFETGIPTRYYLPTDDVRTELLERSDYVSRCPYKGDGQHWHLELGGARIENAAWSLPEPIGDATRIEGFLCFYPAKVEIEVDDEILGTK